MNSKAPHPPMRTPFPLPTIGQLVEFHQVIDCVRAIDVRLDCDAATLSRSKELVRRRIEEREASLESAGTNYAVDWSSELPGSYADALAVFASGGDVDLVLDRLTIQSKTDDQLNRVVRSAWVYLSWMILLAGGGIAIYGAFSLPAINAMRADMNLVPRHTLRPLPMWFNHESAIVGLLVGLAFGLMIASSATRFPAWSAGWFGGNRYRRFRMQKIRSRVASSLRASGQGPGEVAAGDRFEQDYLQSQAAAQLSRMRVFVPVVLIVLVGGVGVMAYCWMLFSPLVALIYDLSTTLVDEGIPR